MPGSFHYKWFTGGTGFPFAEKAVYFSLNDYHFVLQLFRLQIYILSHIFPSFFG